MASRRCAPPRDTAPGRHAIRRQEAAYSDQGRLELCQGRHAPRDLSDALLRVFAAQVVAIGRETCDSATRASSRPWRRSRSRRKSASGPPRTSAIRPFRLPSPSLRRSTPGVSRNGARQGMAAGPRCPKDGQRTRCGKSSGGSGGSVTGVVPPGGGHAPVALAAEHRTRRRRDTAWAAPVVGCCPGRAVTAVGPAAPT
jgi:hypothetical protein